jgi:prolipoprotein diacylglyceryltransferase
MFGLLVAISFLLAAYTLASELKRKESLGILQPMDKKMMVGAPVRMDEYFWNGIFGFILGSKIFYAIFNSEDFFQDPQAALLSTKGNLLAGLICAGIAIAWRYYENKKERLDQPKEVDIKVYPHQLVSEITMAAALGGLLGAKIFHLLEYWSDFMADPIGMFFSGSGLTMYGGLIVGGATVLWYGKKNNIPPLELCDATAPGLMLAYGTGRLGCQLAGDGDWGIVNTLAKPFSFIPDWLWSYKYPNNVISEGVPIPGCVGHHCHELPMGVFPTPMYESIMCIALFFLLWSMRKKIFTPGRLFSWYLLFNGIERFLIESIRVNSQYHIGGLAFTQAQLISTILMIAGITGLVYFKNKKNTASA